MPIFRIVDVSGVFSLKANVFEICHLKFDFFRAVYALKSSSEHDWGNAPLEFASRPNGRDFHNRRSLTAGRSVPASPCLKGRTNVMLILKWQIQY
jgi:hypothetical protein